MTLREARAKATEPLQFGDLLQIEANRMVYLANELKGLGVDEAPCDECDRSGLVECEECDGGRTDDEVSCASCEGDGEIDCCECHGLAAISIEDLSLEQLEDLLADEVHE